MALSIKRFPSNKSENLEQPFQAISIDKLNIPGACMEVLADKKFIIDSYPTDDELYASFKPKDILLLAKKLNILSTQNEWNIDSSSLSDSQPHLSFKDLIECLAQSVLHLPSDVILDKLLQADNDKQAFGFWLLHCLQFQYSLKLIKNDFNIDLLYLFSELKHHDMLPNVKHYK